PPEVNLDAVLGQRYGPEVVRIVRALEAEHTALDTANPTFNVADPPVLIASTADKIVALTSLTHRARRSGDPAEFFAVRPALLALLPHFRSLVEAATGQVPASMTHQLHQALDTLITTGRRAC
ncbi:MAG: hypothetical protein J2P19_26390, partial [Pseudonocardia sp.]|nr:hypothetical protein [Pseudonocardia sp.]